MNRAALPIHWSGRRSDKLDVRLIAAANRDLDVEIKAGKFRENLYYRVNVIHLLMPPLNERGQEILLLAEEFRKKSSRQTCRTVRGISQRLRKF